MFMLMSLLDIMHCPACQGDMTLEVFEEKPSDIHSTKEITDGLLTCTQCETIYPVIQSIPRMVPATLYNAREFCRIYGLAPEKLLTGWEGEKEAITALQEQTEQNFGHEWEHYSRLGWTDDTGRDASNTAETRQWFHEKTLLTHKDLKGRPVLDAGCGNGRFSYAAFEEGGCVISMDLTQSVESARTNLTKQGYPAQVIQGDILHLPFRPQSFPVVFSLGVIQHTGDPLAAVGHLAALLEPEGLLSIRTYRRGNARLEENDAAIRALTTQFSHEELHEFSDILSQLIHFLAKKELYSAINKHICLFWKRYDIFDWYSAPVAAKLTYREMRDIFASHDLTPIRDLDDNTSPEERSFTALSIVGKKETGKL